MMFDRDVIVVGGGPAGIAAAIEAARAGLSVDILEQRPSLGGAIFRQPIEGVAPIRQSRAALNRYAELMSALTAFVVGLRHMSVFLGMDGDGLVLFEDRGAGTVKSLRARAVVIAVGAVETVHPRPGWQLPGVSTAGGLQVMMKETGRPPQQRVLLAGSGPLLVAVAAQMIRLGNPPVAIVEAGDPFGSIGDGLGLLRFPGLLADALSYLLTVVASRTPWQRGTTLMSIERTRSGLEATLKDRNGTMRTMTADRIGLHDGIRANNFGLHPAAIDMPCGPIVIHAGDCREALGAVAAAADGARAGRQVAQLLTAASSSTDEVERQLVRERKAQALLAQLFSPVNPPAPLTSLPRDTILCRCEGRTAGDLHSLIGPSDMLSGREVKHNGRFAMGACQGRFCAAHVAALMNELRPGHPPVHARDLTGQRWPLRPTSIAGLTHVASDDIENDQFRKVDANL